MDRGGSTKVGTPKGRVAAFGSRPYRNAEAVRALDSTLDGLRTLGLYAGTSEHRLARTTDFSQLVRDAEVGMSHYVGRGDRRGTYNALFVAVGDKCRALLDRVHRPAALAHVTDPMVARSLANQVNAVANGESATLLRIAVAAELSGKPSQRVSNLPVSSRNPLRGVLDLYAMGAVITDAPGQPLALTLRDGGRVALEWTGSLYSRDAAGRLRPTGQVDLVV